MSKSKSVVSTRELKYPCVVRAMPEDEYHSRPELNASKLVSLLRTTPAHAEVPKRATSAMNLGKALHRRVLTPLEEPFHLTPLQSTKVEGMVSALNAHPIASELLKGEGDTEVSLFWEWDGVPCRARVDRLTTYLGKPVGIELKTTSDASPDGFTRGQWGVFGLDYHIRARWYEIGLAACGLPVDRILIVAVENEPYHGVMVHEFSMVVRDLAHQRCSAGMDQYKWALAAHRATGRWPGYPFKVNTIELPSWMADGLDQ